MMLEDTSEALQDAAVNGVPIAAGAECGVYMGCINFEYTEVLERGGAKVGAIGFARMFCRFSK